MRLFTNIIMVHDVESEYLENTTEEEFVKVHIEQLKSGELPFDDFAELCTSVIVTSSFVED